MNRRICIWIAALGIGCLVSTGQAQTAAAPKNLSTIHNVEAPSATDRKQIDDFIAGQLATIVSGQPNDQKTASAALLNEVAAVNTVGWSTQYLETFAASLNQQAQAVLKAKPAAPVRARLIVGVAAARVAASTKSFQLADSASVLLNDESEVVVLWGMKTAKYVLPGLISVKVGGKIPLLQQMVATGLKFPGPVLTEAYQGLTLEPMDIQNPANARGAGPQITAVIPSVQALLAGRVGAWGAAVPKQVTDEAIGTGFLVNSSVWKLQSQPQQQLTVQIMQGLLMKASASFAVEADKESLTKLLNRLGSGFSVVATSLTPPDTNLDNAATPVKKINKGMNPAQAAVACDDLNSAINGMALMQGAPPFAPAGTGPTTKPASASSPAAPLAVTK